MATMIPAFNDGTGVPNREAITQNVKSFLVNNTNPQRRFSLQEAWDLERQLTQWVDQTIA
jgi:hypothetical protein